MKHILKRYTVPCLTPKTRAPQYFGRVEITAHSWGRHAKLSPLFLYSRHYQIFSSCIPFWPHMMTDITNIKLSNWIKLKYHETVFEASNMVELITITNIRNEFHFHSMQHNESQMFLNNTEEEWVCACREYWINWGSTSVLTKNSITSLNHSGKILKHRLGTP